MVSATDWFPRPKLLNHWLVRATEDPGSTPGTSTDVPVTVTEWLRKRLQSVSMLVRIQSVTLINSLRVYQARS